MALHTFGFVGLFALSSAGCATSSQRGDAKVTNLRSDRISRLLFPTIDTVYYAATFPRIEVDHLHTQALRIRRLPADAIFTYHLASQETTPEGVYYIDRRRVPWMSVFLRIAAVDIAGHRFFSERLRVGDPNWAFDFTGRNPRGASSASLKGLGKALRQRSDFDLVVTVERPSARQGDFISFTATGEALP